MNINLTQNPFELGKTTGADAAQIIREAIEVNGSAYVILATGASQFETLNHDKSSVALLSFNIIA